jgi:hypothetical protein
MFSKEKILELMKETDHGVPGFPNPCHLEGKVYSHARLMYEELYKLTIDDTDLKRIMEDLVFYHDSGKPFAREVVEKKDKIVVRFLNHWTYSGNIFVDIEKDKYDVKTLFSLYKIIQLHHFRSERYPSFLEGGFLKDLSHNERYLLYLLRHLDSKGRIIGKKCPKASNLSKEELITNNEPPYVFPRNLKEMVNSIINDYTNNQGKKILIVPIGIQGSGKTYVRNLLSGNLSKFFAKGFDDKRVEYASKKYGKTFTLETIPQKIYEEVLREYSLKGKENQLNKEFFMSNQDIFYIDNTNIIPKVRKRIIDDFVRRARGNAFVIGIFFFKTTPDEAIKRVKNRNIVINRDVITKFYLNRFYPSFTEGFHKIYIM